MRIALMKTTSKAKYSASSKELLTNMIYLFWP